MCRRDVNAESDLRSEVRRGDEARMDEAAWRHLVRRLGPLSCEGPTPYTPVEVVRAAVDQVIPVAVVAERSHTLLAQEAADELELEVLGVDRDGIDRIRTLVTDHDGSTPGTSAAILVVDSGGSGVDQLRAGLWRLRLDVDIVVLGVLEVAGGIVPRGASLASLAVRKWGWRALGATVGGSVTVTAVGKPIQYGWRWDNYRQVMALEIHVRSCRSFTVDPPMTEVRWNGEDEADRTNLSVLIDAGAQDTVTGLLERATRWALWRGQDFLVSGKVQAWGGTTSTWGGGYDGWQVLPGGLGGCCKRNGRMG